MTLLQFWLYCNYYFSRPTYDFQLVVMLAPPVICVAIFQVWCLASDTADDFLD